MWGGSCCSTGILGVGGEHGSSRQSLEDGTSNIQRFGLGHRQGLSEGSAVSDQEHNRYVSLQRTAGVCHVSRRPQELWSVSKDHR